VVQSVSGAKIISQAPTAKQGGAQNGGGAFLWHTKKINYSCHKKQATE
jgi:hypothetical protein